LDQLELGEKDRERWRQGRLVVWIGMSRSDVCEKKEVANGVNCISGGECPIGLING
jgi:hypothetical protein